MAETIRLIADYGVTIAIVCLFIYAWWDDRRNRNQMLDTSLKLEHNNNEILNEMKITNANTSKSLELLHISMQHQLDLLKEHDEGQEALTREVRSIGSKVGNLVEKIGKENIKKLGFYFIPPKDIILKPNLFKKDNNK